MAIVFQHLPKTGGTSLHCHLVKFFSPDHICPERFGNLAMYSSEELGRFRFFSGHFDKDQLRQIPSENQVVTLLRNPKARLLSLYYFWKSHKLEYILEHSLHQVMAAKTQSVLDFLCEKRFGVPGTIDNVYARNIIGFSGFHRLREKHASCEDIAEAAIHEMAGFHSYGILEKISVSFEKICASLGVPGPRATPWEMRLLDKSDPHREAVEKEALTPEIEERLSKLTNIDTIVYEYFSSRF